MNKNFIILLSAGLLLLSGASVRAGGGSGAGNGGSGGDAVVCRSASTQEIQRIEMLDVTEARLLNGLTPKLGSADLSVNEKLEIVFKQIERLDPTRARRYREAVADWAYKKAMWTRETLVEISDADPKVVPDGCKIEQIAIRQDHWDYWYENEEQKPLLTINLNLWQTLDRDNQTALILHELFYWDTRHIRKVQNSRPARALNAVAFSGQFESMDVAAYLDLAKKMFLPDLEIQGLLVDPNHVEFNSAGRVVSAQAGRFTRFMGTAHIQGQDVPFYEDARLDDGGHLIETTFRDHGPVLMTIYGKAKVTGEVRLDQSGTVTWFEKLVEPATLTVAGLPLPCVETSGYTDHHRRFEISCSMADGSEIKNVNLQLKVVQAGTIAFDSQGTFAYSGDQSTLKLSGTIRSGQGTLEFSSLRRWGNDLLGVLSSPATIQVKGVSIPIDGRVHLRDFSRVVYFEPKSDFNLDGIAVASKVGCGFLGLDVRQTVVELNDDFKLAKFVLAAPETFNWTDDAGRAHSLGASQGDLVSRDPNVVEKNSWCDEYDYYFRKDER